MIVVICSLQSTAVGKRYESIGKDIGAYQKFQNQYIEL